MGSGSRRSVAGLVCAVLLVAAGCGGGGDAAGDEPSRTSATDAPPTTEAPATTSTTAELSDEEAVLAAYEAYWDAWLAASDPPDPDDPALAGVMDGEALAAVVDDLAEKVAFDQAVRPASPSRFRFRLDSVQVNGDSAVGTSCVLDDLLVVQRETDEVLNSAVWDRKIAVSFVRSGETWRVSRHEFLQTEEVGMLCDFD